MEQIPVRKAKLERFNGFYIVYPKNSSINKEYGIPRSYVIGLYSDSLNTFSRTHYISGFEPSKHYPLIKTCSDHYSSDTTKLDNIEFTNDVLVGRKSLSVNNQVFIATIYRKTALEKRTANIPEYIPWKREIVYLTKEGLVTNKIKEANNPYF